MRSSILLSLKNKNILIDATPDFLKQVRQNKIKKIDAVLITHPHLDAYGGIGQFDKWLKSPLNVFCQKQTRKIIEKKFKKLNNLAFKNIKPFKRFKIGPVEILPLPVRHSIINEKKFPTLAYKIGNLIYCSDVKKIPADSRRYFKNIKTLILDSAMYFNKQIFSHLNTSDSILLGKKLRVKNLYLTQIGHSYPPFKIAQNEINRFAKMKKIKTRVFLSFDGLKIKIN